MVFACLVNGFVVLFVAWAAAYMLLHRRRRRSQRGRNLLISPMSGLVISAMLLRIQAILQPEVRYRIAEEQKEVAPEDENGKEPPGGKLFHHQLQKIRKGEGPKNLTVKLTSKI